MDGSMNRGLLIAAVVAALASLATAGWTWVKLQALEDEIAMRPRVAVINFHGELLKRIQAGEDRDAAAQELVEAGERLVEAGYLVLDEKSIYAYDDAIKVSP